MFAGEPACYPQRCLGIDRKVGGVKDDADRACLTRLIDRSESEDWTRGTAKTVTATLPARIRRRPVSPVRTHHDQVAAELPCFSDDFFCWIALCRDVLNLHWPDGDVKLSHSLHGRLLFGLAWPGRMEPNAILSVVDRLVGSPVWLCNVKHDEPRLVSERERAGRVKGLFRIFGEVGREEDCSKPLHGSFSLVQNLHTNVSRCSWFPSSSPDLRHKPEGKVSGTSALCQRAVHSSGSTARVRSKWSTASNWTGRLAWK